MVLQTLSRTNDNLIYYKDLSEEYVNIQKSNNEHFLILEEEIKAIKIKLNETIKASKRLKKSNVELGEEL